MPEGTTGGLTLLGLSLEPVRVDSLARMFATAFCLAALLAVIYGLQCPRPACSRSRSSSTPVRRSAGRSPGTW